MNDESNLYAVLGVERGAPAKEIKRAYRRKAKATHPDVSPEPEAAAAQFHLISLAYETLIDDEARRIYDETGKSKEKREAPKEERARALLAGLYGEVIEALLSEPRLQQMQRWGMRADDPEIDVVRKLSQALGSGIRKLDDRLKDLDRDIAGLEKLRGRVMANEKADALFDELVDGKLRTRKVERAALKSEREVAALASGMLEGCRDVVAEAANRYETIQEKMRKGTW